MVLNTNSAAGAFGPLADAIDRWVKGMVWLAGKFDEEGLKAARDMAETAMVIGAMLASALTGLYFFWYKTLPPA